MIQSLLCTLALYISFIMQCRVNVVSNPSKDFNACDDFFLLVINRHIITAAMGVLGMKNVKEIPSSEVLPNSGWSLWTTEVISYI